MAILCASVREKIRQWLTVFPACGRELRHWNKYKASDKASAKSDKIAYEHTHVV